MTSGPGRVAAVDGDEDHQRRLGELGIRLGAVVSVIQHNGPGGVLVAVNDDGRISLDAATAATVTLRPLEPNLPRTTISALVPGDRARIVGLGKGASAYRHHLMAMGLTPGVELEIMRVAPLGDPVELRVRGCSISLRRDEAQLLTVERL